jgi:ABC-type glycerol-3-phosphate transport system substrate-binding protein
VNDYNNYAIENNLNSFIELNVVNDTSFTMEVTNYEETLLELFERKSNKYDFIFYDNIYSIRFGKYLEPLNNILSKEHVNMYLEGIASQTCIYRDKLVALPVFVDCNVIYYNEDYLKKYDQKIPKTWDEFISVGSYVLEKEKKANNTDFIAYNGYFADREGGFCSIYEFIYSYRNSVDSSFPKITGDEAVNALEKIKEMKEKIASNEIFKASKGFGLDKYLSGNSLFFKYWYVPTYISENKKVFHLPGVIEGISGSAIGGYNIGINKYSKAERRNEVIQAFTYLTSKVVQKKIVKDYLFFSPIPSLYEEKDICQIIDCDFFKKAQLIGRPVSASKDYDDYSQKFRKNIFRYIYDNEASAAEVLRDIEDLTKIYTFSVKSDDSSAGLIIFIAYIIITILILSSLVLLYTKKCESQYHFLSKDFWYVIIFGLVIMTWGFFFAIDEATVWQCHLRYIVLSFAFYFVLLPMFHKLIVCFPEENKISEWISHHRYLFLFSFILIDEFFILLIYIKPYTLLQYRYNDGKLIEKCVLNHWFSKLNLFISYLIKFIVVLAIWFFTFMEWSITEIRIDVHVMSAAIYMDAVGLITILILNNIPVDSHILYYVMKAIIYLLIVIINFIFLYAFRVIKLVMKGKSDEELNNQIRNLIAYEKKLENNSLSRSSVNSNSITSSTKDSNGSLADKYKKIVGYHYKTSSPSISSIGCIPMHKDSINDSKNNNSDYKGNVTKLTKGILSS